MQRDEVVAVTALVLAVDLSVGFFTLYWMYSQLITPHLHRRLSLLMKSDHSSNQPSELKSATGTFDTQLSKSPSAPPSSAAARSNSSLRNLTEHCTNQNNNTEHNTANINSHNNNMMNREQCSKLFFSHRSRVSLWILAATVTLHCLIQQPLSCVAFLLSEGAMNNSRSRRTLFMLTTLMMAVMGICILMRGWHLFVHFKYTVQLKNFGWLSLLNPQNDHRHSRSSHRSLLASSSSSAAAAAVSGVGSINRSSVTSGGIRSGIDGPTSSSNPRLSHLHHRVETDTILVEDEEVSRKRAYSNGTSHDRRSVALKLTYPLPSDSGLPSRPIGDDHNHTSNSQRHGHSESSLQLKNDILGQCLENCMDAWWDCRDGCDYSWSRCCCNNNNNNHNNSMNNTHSSRQFWIRHKKFLTSEATMVNVCVVLALMEASLIFLLYHSHWPLVLAVLGLCLLLHPLATLLFVWSVPETPTYQRLELQMLAVLMLLSHLTLLGFAAGLGQSSRLFIAMRELNAAVFYAGASMVCFYITPTLIVWPKVKNGSLKLTDTRGVLLSPEARRRRYLGGHVSARMSRDEMFETLSNIDWFTDFMLHCCDEYSSENLLALLEFREWKQRLRKQLWADENDHSVNTHTLASSVPPRSITHAISNERSAKVPTPKHEAATISPLSVPTSISLPKTTMHQRTLDMSGEFTHSSDDESSSSSDSSSNQNDDSSHSSASNDSSSLSRSGSRRGSQSSGKSSPSKDQPPPRIPALTRSRSKTASMVLKSWSEKVLIGGGQNAQHNSDEFHRRLYESLGCDDALSLIVVAKDLSDWDIQWKLSLRQLGTKSAIVRDTRMSWSDRARCLFDKYVAMDSPLQLNVSHRTRVELRSLIDRGCSGSGSNSDRESLSHTQLLFVFDVIVPDIIDNLLDSFRRFLYERKKSVN